MTRLAQAAQTSDISNTQDITNTTQCSPASTDQTSVMGLDQLQAALFYLMTQYSFSQCPKVAAEIVDHLNTMLRHPHMDLLPRQHGVLSSLLNHWRMHREIRHLAPTDGKPN